MLKKGPKHDCRTFSNFHFVTIIVVVIIIVVAIVHAVLLLSVHGTMKLHFQNQFISLWHRVAC